MKRKTILNYYSKSIISLLLIILLSFSILPPRYTSSESIKLPSGWNFSSSYQNIPVTLNKVSYYAYEIYKVDNNKKTVGWLIVDSNNKVITDKDTYEKLAMAATVTKWVDISQVMEITSLTDGLKSLDWQISWFEKSSGVIKILNSVAGTLLKHQTATMTARDTAKSIVTIGEGIINLVPIDLEDKYLNEIVEKSADSYITLLISSGSLLEDLTKGYNPLPELFSVVKAILRKAAYIGFKHGYKNLLKANEILKTHSGPWSYEEANDLLTYLEEGEPFAIAYANWYTTLIPSSNWEAVWENVFEPLLPAFADLTNGMKQNLLNQASVPTEKIIRVLDSQGNLSMPVIVKEQIDLFSLAANYTQISIVNGAVVFGEKAGSATVLVDKFKKFFKDFIKLYQNPLHYNKVLDDIKFYSSKFNIYRAFYDVSIEDSPASRTYNAIKNEEEASVKDKTIYKIGDRVQATDYINVREDASLKGKVKYVIKKGEIGTIESNYKIADGYRWWTVKWDSGPEGWCAGEYLQLYKGENSSGEIGQEFGKWVLVLGESLPVLSGISPAGYALIGGECEKSPICWDTLSLVHSGDLLEYISTDTKTYSSSSTLSFPGCTKAYKVKDKNGNIGWLIGEWDGIVLAQVVDSKTAQNFKPVSFSKITGKWSGHWRGTFFEEGDLSFVFQQENMLTFSGTGVLTLNGSDKTRNVTVSGSIVNNSLSFLEAQPDGSYKYYSGTISSDGKTIEGWKYSYDSLAVPLGEFKLTFQGN